MDAGGGLVNSVWPESSEQAAVRGARKPETKSALTPILPAKLIRIWTGSRPEVGAEAFVCFFCCLGRQVRCVAFGTRRFGPFPECLSLTYCYFALLRSSALNEKRLSFKPRFPAFACAASASPSAFSLNGEVETVVKEKKGGTGESRESWWTLDILSVSPCL